MGNKSILLVGSGGYGLNYLNYLMEEHCDSLVGIVDPIPPEAAIASGKTIYNGMEEFFVSGRADVVIISSPIQFHSGQIMEALARGADVLCEKPLCATLDQARKLESVSREAGRKVAVGFQFSFDAVIGRVKRDIMGGVYGRATRARAIKMSKRDSAYYARNRWAGRRSVDGVPVNDSVVSNANAHYLNNILFMLGDRPDAAAPVASVEARLYRAFPIENFDTAFMKLNLDVMGVGVPFYMSTSHSVEGKDDRYMIEFENGAIYGDSGVVRGVAGGEDIEYGAIDGNGIANKVEAILNYSRDGAELPSHIVTVLPHMTVIDELSRLPVIDTPGRIFDEDMRIYYDTLELI